MKLLKDFAIFVVSIPRNGLVQNLCLLKICIYIPIKMKLYPLFLNIYKIRRISTQKKKLNGDMESIRKWSPSTTHTQSYDHSGIYLSELFADENQLEAVEIASRGKKQIVIAEIDFDGDWYSKFGELRDVPTISKEKFLKRDRCKLQVVLHNQELGVKKLYGKEKALFVNEFKILDKLAKAGCSVPTILDIDVDELSLTVRYVRGEVLREKLARSGAILRNRDVEKDEYFMKLDAKGRHRNRIKEGRRVLHNEVDDGFIDKTFNELSKIHSERVVWRDVKYGNIIIEKSNSEPCLIDFDWAYDCPGLSKEYFNRLRDSDIDKFNDHFGTEHLTYEKLIKKIKEMEDDYVYAPIYFGAGLRAGPIWRVDNGFGRWNFILKKNYPPISGKRILDLGANNGHNAMQLLRNGAEEVIGIELFEQYIEQAKIVKAGYEWADNKKYKFQVINSNMAELPNLDLGKFDIVQALCSFYYLSEEKMNEIANYISTISNCFILQCNTQKNIGRDNPETYIKAEVDYTLALLKRHGFIDTKVIAPFRYTRPLVIGKKPNN